MTSSTSLVSTLDPPSLGPAHPIHANITIASLTDTVRMITIAGQPPQPLSSSASQKFPRSLRAQMELCLSRISTCLEASGANVSDLTRLMYYFTERVWTEEDALKMVIEVVTPWLKGHRPASCCVVVKGLSQPEFLCEFEAQAVVKDPCGGEVSMPQRKGFGGVAGAVES